MAGLATVSGKKRLDLMKKQKNKKPVPSKHEYNCGKGKTDQAKK